MNPCDDETLTKRDKQSHPQVGFCRNLNSGRPPELGIATPVFVYSGDVPSKLLMHCTASVFCFTACRIVRLGFVHGTSRVRQF